MLLRNDGGNSKNWLKVRVRCSKSNRTGLGTKIEVEADGFRRTEEIGGQSSYLSQNYQEAHFGLNHTTEALGVKVTFSERRYPHFRACESESSGHCCPNNGTHFHFEQRGRNRVAVV